MRDFTNKYYYFLHNRIESFRFVLGVIINRLGENSMYPNNNKKIAIHICKKENYRFEKTHTHRHRHILSVI